MHTPNTPLLYIKSVLHLHLIWGRNRAPFPMLKSIFISQAVSIGMYCRIKIPRLTGLNCGLSILDYKSVIFSGDRRVQDFCLMRFVNGH